MRLLPIEARGEIASTGKYQPVQVTYHRPKNLEEQGEGVVVLQYLQGVVAFQQWQKWNEAGKATRFQDRLRGWRVSPIHRPAPITQRAAARYETDTWSV